MDPTSAPSDTPGETVSSQPSGTLGARLRQAREQAGISLRGLARQVGVSPSLVSQIEHGRVTPSVATLYAMASALGLLLDDLFRDNEPSAGEATAGATADGGANGGANGGDAAAAGAAGGDSPLLLHPAGRKVIRLASGVRWERLTRLPDNEVEFVYVVYEVGGASCAPDALVRHGGKEYAFLISGCLGVSIGFEEFEMRPGDSISFDAQTPHRLWTIGNEPAVAVWAILNRRGDRRVAPKT